MLVALCAAFAAACSVPRARIDSDGHVTMFAGENVPRLEFTARGVRALHRCVDELDGTSVLRDPAAPYGLHFTTEIATLSLNWALGSNDF